jgi:hypothetical protein
MANTSTAGEVLSGYEPKKMSDFLNVITILTFIGSGLAIVFSVLGFVNAQANYDKMLATRDQLDKAPSFMKAFIGPDPVGAAQKNLDNKLPIFLIGMVSAILCIYGAVMMRKLKKTGFSIYLIGEIVLPFLSIFLFLGISLMGSLTIGIAIFFPLLFIIMYASQLKYMS